MAISKSVWMKWKNVWNGWILDLQFKSLPMKWKNVWYGLTLDYRFYYGYFSLTFFIKLSAYSFNLFSS